MDRVMLDFNAKMERLVGEIGRVLPEFRFIRVRRLRVSATYNLSKKKQGVLAYLLPLKYKDGRPVETQVNGNKIFHYGMAPVYHQGNEVLYYIYFMLPRFLNLSFREKLETVIHEMYHISPRFNGDVRRLKGRSYLHGNSLKEYDENISHLTSKFLKLPHNKAVYSFLKFSHRELEAKYQNISAKHIVEPKPQLLKVARVKKKVDLYKQLELFASTI